MAHYLGPAGRTSVRFKVTGLRRDGTTSGVNTAQWLVTRLPLWTVIGIWVGLTFLIRLLVILVEIVLDMVVDSASASYESPRLKWRRSIDIIANQAASGAASFGHALQRKRGHLWLVTTPRRFALTQIDNGAETVLWHVANPYQPVLSIKQAEVRWPDASHVAFSGPKGERELLSARYS